jgi:hypothetical protein
MQGAAVQRAIVDGKLPSVYGKSSGTAQGAAVQRAMAED